jgi:hypothetical protein
MPEADISSSVASSDGRSWTAIVSMGREFKHPSDRTHDITETTYIPCDHGKGKHGPREIRATVSKILSPSITMVEKQTKTNSYGNAYDTKVTDRVTTKGFESVIQANSPHWKPAEFSIRESLRESLRPDETQHLDEIMAKSHCVNIQYREVQDFRTCKKCSDYEVTFSWPDDGSVLGSGCRTG